MPESIENAMVVDSLWEKLEKYEETPRREKERGYRKFGTGEFVSEEDAYEYAIEQCIHGSELEQEEFRKMLVEWFYSGNWIYG